jgi:hypothetical protein
VPRDSVLRFGLASEPLLSGAAATPAVVRVRLDGELLFEHEATLATSITRHVVPLPRRGRASARLDLEVHGASARAVFFDPLVGPRTIGSPGARPWPEVRPDLLVFVADTLRADTLTACGGKGLAPNLDALAETGLCFTSARSTATWTLASHATLFTGLYLRQEAQGVAPITAAQIAREDYRLLGAFDLGSDPTESRDEVAAGSAWPREFLAQHAAELEAAMRPLVDRLEGKPREIDAEKAAELRALGY